MRRGLRRFGGGSAVLLAAVLLAAVLAGCGDDGGDDGSAGGDGGGGTPSAELLDDFAAAVDNGTGFDPATTECIIDAFVEQFVDSGEVSAEELDAYVSGTGGVDGAVNSRLNDMIGDGSSGCELVAE